jgi:hypothetical protein
MLGFVFASGVGTAFAALAEYFGRTLRGTRGIVEVLGAPPLATIPPIRTRRERRRRIRNLVLLVLAGLIVAALILFGPTFPPNWEGFGASNPLGAVDVDAPLPADGE